MSALKQSWDELYRSGEKLPRRSGYLTRNDLQVHAERISEAPLSSDNDGMTDWPGEFVALDRAIESQHAEISRLMHARNLDPSNEELKADVGAAFNKLAILQTRWVDALKPYQEVEPSVLSEAEQHNIDEARKILAMYKHENST